MRYETLGSLAEALLFTAKSTDRLGRVEDGNTVCDYDPEEAKRRASLSLDVEKALWPKTWHVK